MVVKVEQKINSPFTCIIQIHFIISINQLGNIIMGIITELIPSFPCLFLSISHKVFFLCHLSIKWCLRVSFLSLLFFIKHVGGSFILHLVILFIENSWWIHSSKVSQSSLKFKIMWNLGLPWILVLGMHQNPKNNKVKLGKKY